jgi:hypothetical protein
MNKGGGRGQPAGNFEPAKNFEPGAMAVKKAVKLGIVATTVPIGGTV